MSNYTKGQLAALQWLKEKPGLLLPHTTNRPYCLAWKDHKPASVTTFWSLERRGLAERRNYSFWHLTAAGEEACKLLEKSRSYDEKKTTRSTL